MSTQIAGSMNVKALEAYTRDSGRNIARIDPKTMHALGVSMGGALEIIGERQTVSKCMPLYKGDFDKGIMRIDGLIRENSGVDLGDTAGIRKIEAAFAEKIYIAPVRGEARIDEQYVIESLRGIPFVLGDKVLIPMGLEWKPLVVLDARPSAEVYMIGDKSKAEVLPSIT
jgi:transitional endoplasmic reticulum ATPase